MSASRDLYSNYKTLVVDDSQEAVDLITLMLQGVGMRVVTATSGRDALRATYQHRPDAILLDIMMPEMDGFTTGQRLREISDAPIIMVTAKDQIEDMLRAFELGADDYVVKPFEKRELIARIYACIRRAHNAAQQDGLIILSNGDLVVDPARFRALVYQREVRLTRTEFDLLLYLAKNRDRVLTHEMILAAVWGDDADVRKDTLKQFMFTLRAKIEPDPRRPRWLVTEHGVGYSLISTSRS